MLNLNIEILELVTIIVPVGHRCNRYSTFKQTLSPAYHGRCCVSTIRLQDGLKKISGLTEMMMENLSGNLDALSAYHDLNIFTYPSPYGFFAGLHIRYIIEIPIKSNLTVLKINSLTNAILNLFVYQSIFLLAQY